MPPPIKPLRYVPQLTLFLQILTDFRKNKENSASELLYYRLYITLKKGRECDKKKKKKYY